MNDNFEKKEQINKVSDGLLIFAEVLVGMLMLISIVFMVASKFLWKEPGEKKYTEIHLLNDWTVTYDDGSMEEISFPLTYRNVPNNTTYIFETTIPDYVTDKDFFSTRALDSRFRIFVGDELRREVTQEFKYFYWEDYTSRYFYVPLSSDDIGKTIRMETFSLVKPSRYFIDCVIGEKTSIAKFYIEDYIVEMVLGVLFLAMGAVIAVFGLAVRITTQGKVRVDYLGWSMVSVALWDLTQGFFRDFLFDNLIAINAFPPIALTMFTLTFALYLNALQKDRYRYMYVLYIIVSALVGMGEIVLALLRVKSFYEDLPIVFFMMALLFIYYQVTVFTDKKRGYGDEYKLVRVGLMILTISGITQMTCFIFGITASGIFFSVGFAIATMFATMHAVKNLFRMEEEKKRAIMEASVKSDFLATMSHEIRTPINAILGMNEIIMRETSEGNIKSYSNDVDHAGKMLLTLINDILDFSKIDSGKMEIIPDEYSLKDLTSGCYNLIAKKAEEKKLKFVVDVDSSLPSKLYGDEVRIQQIIVNLLSNAVKYTREGRVVFKIYGSEIDEDHVMLNIYVSDTGIGIKEEDMKRLFTAFGRIDQVKNRGIEGTGLGLAITSRLTSMMKGKIEVESEYGEGTIFKVSIPQKIISKVCVGDVNCEKVAVVENTKSVNKDLFTAPNVRILVVDDVLVNLKVAQSLLKKTGMKIDTAISGAAALDRVATTKYDIILLDHMMPEKDGVETLHDMRKLENNPNIMTPVIVLTANVVAGAKEQYLEEGFDDYLSKPFTLAEIQKLLLKFLPEEKLGGSISETTVKENELELQKIVEQQKLGDAIISDVIWSNIDKSQAMTNCHNDVMLLRQRLETFLAEDKRKMLSSNFEKEDWSNYKMIIRSIRAYSFSIGALSIGELGVKLEAAFDENIKPDIERLHNELCVEYDRFLVMLENELKD